MIAIALITIIAIKKEKRSRRQMVCLLIAGAYTEIVLLLTLLLRHSYNGTHLKIIPFWIFSEVNRYGLKHVVQEVVVNLLMFFPIGLFISMGLSHLKTMTILFIGLGLSLIVESLQFFLKVGAFEINDLIFNTVGIYVGHLLGVYLTSLSKSH